MELTCQSGTGVAIDGSSRETNTSIVGLDVVLNIHKGELYLELEGTFYFYVLALMCQVCSKLRQVIYHKRRAEQ